jgi:hypothetical protein
VMAKNYYQHYLRILAHYLEWVNHIPELELLSDVDKSLAVMCVCHALI